MKKIKFTYILITFVIVLFVLNSITCFANNGLKKNTMMDGSIYNLIINSDSSSELDRLVFANIEYLLEKYNAYHIN